MSSSMNEPVASRQDGAAESAGTIGNGGANPKPDSGADASSGERTAGQLLRQARQAQGMHVAALAAAIKVTPQKLEALENERFDLLPDPTFARALALAICRYLKIDPEPVMSRLPQPREHRLEHINRGLATPFRDYPGRHEPIEWLRFLKPALLAPLLLIIAAVVVYFVPVRMWSLPSFGTGVSAPVGGAPSAPVSTAPATSAEQSSDGSVVVETIHSSPTDVSSATTTSTSSASGGLTSVAAPLTIRATGESWVEVVDGQGRVLVSRMLPAGETVGLDGPAPLKLRIGNAEGTQVMFKGQAVNLAGSTKDNVARLELK
jgi:cytoskeleton protein RodZ